MKDLAGSLAAARRQNAEGCVKTWEDLARYREVFTMTNPERIIEAGTFSGKSACWLAKASGCPVLTIDVDPRNVDLETMVRGSELGVTFLVGRSTDPKLVATAAGWSAGARTMVILDSDHSADTVLAELDAYGPLVTRGCYLVVEDTIVRWMPDQMTTGGGPYRGSPLDAVETWLPAHPEFEVDQGVEDLFETTQFPGGWLQRIG